MNEATSSTREALHHVQVVDMTSRVAGPFCTKLLAGFGARVVKVEPPGSGDAARSAGPFVGDEEGAERSLPFLWLNTGKESITLDPRSADGSVPLKNLIQCSDVLVESFPPGTMDALGLSFDACRRLNPRLVVCSISNFGQDGPYRDFLAEELQLYALAGAMYLSGEKHLPPLGPGTPVCHYTAGLTAYLAILMALRKRARTGEGEHIDVSIFESALDLIEVALAGHLRNGSIATRGSHAFAPWGLFSCLDGYVAVIGAPFRKWRRGAEMFEQSRLLDPKYRELRDRVRYREELHALIQPWLDRHTRKETCEPAYEKGLAFGQLSSFDEVLTSPQHQAREFFVEIEHPDAGRYEYCSAPFKMSATPYVSGRAPRLGEHNGRVRDGERKPPGTSSPPRGDDGSVLTGDSLEELCVIDLTHSWAGPHCTRLLADYGAEVILVEYPRRLAMHRGGRREAESYNNQPAWFQVNRNKRSVTLDLGRPEHRSIFADLVRHADVVVDNCRPGVMKRLGFDRTALLRLKPDLITLSMSAYGETGPHADRPAYGGALEAVSGIQVLTGYEPTGKPQRIRELDVVNGLGGACAVVTALLHRDRTAEGQHIDFSQLEFSTFALIGEHLLEYSANRVHAPRDGNRHRRFAPQGCYSCAQEDQWVTLTVTSDDEWRRLCDVIGKPAWGSDTRFANTSSRREHHAEIDRAIESWTRGRTHREAMEILRRHAIPAGAVFTTADLRADPHLESRGYFVDDPADAETKMMGLPFRTSGGSGAVRWRGPDLGASNLWMTRVKLGGDERNAPTFGSDEIRTCYEPE